MNTLRYVQKNISKIGTMDVHMKREYLGTGLIQNLTKDKSLV